MTGLDLLVAIVLWVVLCLVGGERSMSRKFVWAAVAFFAAMFGMGALTLLTVFAR